MAGFNNTPPGSEFHRHSSWGRTRRPKNLNGATSTAVVTVENQTGAAPTLVTEGYSTENQRFLHVSLDSNGTDDNLVIYVWHHAFGAWSLFMVPTDLDGDVDTAFKSATIAGSTTRRNFIFDIAGADRVAFVQSGNTDTFTLYAACSTF